MGSYTAWQPLNLRVFGKYSTEPRRLAFKHAEILRLRQTGCQLPPPMSLHVTCLTGSWYLTPMIGSRTAWLVSCPELECPWPRAPFQRVGFANNHSNSKKQLPSTGTSQRTIEDGATCAAAKALACCSWFTSAILRVNRGFKREGCINTVSLWRNCNGKENT